MKNTKQYRAETLRSALEQVKKEMGPDAIVLSHKTVRAGSFLGVGGRNLVEVRVAADPNAKPDDGASSGPDNDMLAQSRQSAKPKRGQSPILTAIASRTYAENGGAQPGGILPAGIPSPQNAPAAQPLAAAPAPAPRLIRQAPPVIRTDAQAARPNPVASELGKLRAELRELKLALPLAGRPVFSAARSQEVAEFEGEPALYDTPYFEAYMMLMEIGLSQEFARQVMGSVIRQPDGMIIEAALGDLIRSVMTFAADEWSAESAAPAGYVASVFIGPTGVGKTTTIAKLAAKAAMASRQRVELITLDTYRLGAVEQLKKYAEVIGAGCHLARSVAELDELIKRHAGQARILIDTAGRSPNDLADQIVLADYFRETRSILKCLVLQATTHQSDAMVAVKKFDLFGIDHLVMTKLDETSRPGASVGTAKAASLPLAYICAGQKVPDDIQRANPTTLAKNILRGTLLSAAMAA